jgi:hypothetical protein
MAIVPILGQAPIRNLILVILRSDFSDELPDGILELAKIKKMPDSDFFKVLQPCY